jgi:hypothetical protein
VWWEWGCWWVWGGGVWGCGGVGGGFPMRSNIPRSALCATLDTYNFNFINLVIMMIRQSSSMQNRWKDDI